MWKKQLCRHHSQWKRRGRRCSGCRSRDSPAAHSEDYGEAGCPLAAHGGPRWCRDPLAAHGGHNARAGCDPVGSPCSSRLLAGPVEPWREDLTLDQVCQQDLWPRGGTHARAVCSWTTAAHGRDPRWRSSWRIAPRGKDSRRRSSWRTVSCGWDLTLEQQKSVESSPWGGSNSRQKSVMNWLQPPFPIPLCCLGGNR